MRGEIKKMLRKTIGILLVVFCVVCFCMSAVSASKNPNYVNTAEIANHDDFWDWSTHYFSFARYEVGKVKCNGLDYPDYGGRGAPLIPHGSDYLLSYNHDTNGYNTGGNPLTEDLTNSVHNGIHYSIVDYKRIFHADGLWYLSDEGLSKGIDYGYARITPLKRGVYYTKTQHSAADQLYKWVFKYNGNSNPPDDTKITVEVSDNNISRGSTATVTAKLTDLNGKPISNQNLGLYINNGNKGILTTNKDGVVTYTIDDTSSPKTFKVKFSYDADPAHWNCVSDETAIKVF